MLPFGHAGITTAAVKFYEYANSKKIKGDHYIDYRVFILGSMLPGGNAGVQSLEPLFTGIKKYFFEPYVFLPEIAGAIIMGYFFLRLAADKRISEFVKHGRL